MFDAGMALCGAEFIDIVNRFLPSFRIGKLNGIVIAEDRTVRPQEEHEERIGTDFDASALDAVIEADGCLDAFQRTAARFDFERVASLLDGILPLFREDGIPDAGAIGGGVDDARGAARDADHAGFAQGLEEFGLPRLGSGLLDGSRLAVQEKG